MFQTTHQIGNLRLLYVQAKRAVGSTVYLSLGSEKKIQIDGYRSENQRDIDGKLLLGTNHPVSSNMASKKKSLVNEGSQLAKSLNYILNS